MFLVCAAIQKPNLEKVFKTEYILKVKDMGVGYKSALVCLWNWIENYDR